MFGLYNKVITWFHLVVKFLIFIYNSVLIRSTPTLQTRTRNYCTDNDWMEAALYAQFSRVLYVFAEHLLWLLGQRMLWQRTFSNGHWSCGQQNSQWFYFGQLIC